MLLIIKKEKKQLNDPNPSDISAPVGVSPLEGIKLPNIDMNTNKKHLY